MSDALRIAAVAVRKYSREPETRPQAAKLLAAASVAIAIEQLGAGEAALHFAELLTQHTQAQRAAAARARGGG